MMMKYIINTNLEENDMKKNESINHKKLSHRHLHNEANGKKKISSKHTEVCSY